MAKRNSNTAVLDRPPHVETANAELGALPETEDRDADDGEPDDSAIDDSDGEVETAADDTKTDTDLSDDDAPEESDTSIAAKLLKEIQDSYDGCAEAEQEFIMAKEHAASLKKIWEGRVDTHMALVKRSKNGEVQGELLDGAEPYDGQASDQQDESWKDLSLGEALLGVPAGIIDKLADAELRTMGELTAFSSEQRLLTDVPGIGQLKADKIEEALTAFWERRRQQSIASAPTPPPEQPEPADSDEDAE